MPLQLGYLDSAGHPRLRVRVSGTHPTNVVDVEAYIDTGFTGFLTLPIVKALPLGLILLGDSEHTIADGSKLSSFAAGGTVTVLTPLEENLPGVGALGVESENAAGLILLCAGPTLLGMEFIRSLKKHLLVSPVVALLDEEILRQAVALFQARHNSSGV